jgi:hypothetical protein
MTDAIRKGFGWDVEREREIPWRIARKLRLPHWPIRSHFDSGAECLPDFECEANLR